MRYFVDCEFDEERGDIDEDAQGPEVRLISLAIVAEDGREAYAVSKDYCDPGRTGWWRCNDWVQQNVLPHLFDAAALVDGVPCELITDRLGMRQAVVDIVGDDPAPEFWGYHCVYDWYLVCRLFGRWDQQPSSWNRGGSICHDLKTVAMTRGISRPTKDLLPKDPGAAEHNALVDARWIRDAFLELVRRDGHPWCGWMRRP